MFSVFYRNILLFIFLFLIQDFLNAQNDSLKRVRININSGVIFNRAFSNVPRNNEFIDEYTTEERTPNDSASKMRAGFSVGADFLFFPKERLKAVLGLSFSRTTAAHHYKYESMGPTNKIGFTELRTLTNNDVEEIYSTLNFQAGIRNRLFKNLFLTSSLVLNNPLQVKRTTTGITEYFYTNNSGGAEATAVLNKQENFKVPHPPKNLSFRFHIDYQFKLGESLARIYLYRNLGLIYTMPWWELGFSYTVRK